MAGIKQGETVFHVPVADVHHSPHNHQGRCRDVRELQASIETRGQEVPAIVRSLGKGNGYELVAGARRHKALVNLKRETIAAVVREYTDDEARRVCMVENAVRLNLSPIEAGETVSELIALGISVKDVAAELGKTEGWVRQAASIASLSKKWRQRIADAVAVVSQWPASLLMLISRLPEAQQDAFLAAHSKEGACVHRRFLESVPSIAELKEEIADVIGVLSGAAFSVSDDELDEKAGSCVSCPKRAAADPSLWPDLFGDAVGPDAIAGIPKDDRCLDLACWQRKTTAALTRMVETAKLKHPDINVVSVQPDTMARRLSGVIDESAVESVYVFSVAKKGERGAVPTISVDGKATAGIVWRKQEGSTKSPASGKKKAAGGLTSLAERRRQLAYKRDKMMIGKVLDRLNEITQHDNKCAALAGRLRDSNISVFNLLVLFGSLDPASRVRPPSAEKELLDPIWARVHTVKEQPLAVQTICYVWKSRIGGMMAAREPSAVADAVHIAKMIGLDMVAISEEAVTAFPAPPGWRLLNADGSKKAAGEKATEKKKKTAGKKQDASAGKRDGHKKKTTKKAKAAAKGKAPGKTKAAASKRPAAAKGNAPAKGKAAGGGRP